MSRDRVTDQLHRYGRWVEREAGQALRSATDPSGGDTSALDQPVVGAAAARTRRSVRWPTIRWLRPAFVALAAAAMIVVVAAVVTLRPDGDPAALYTRADDPDGPLFVLPAGGAGYDVSGGIINTTSARSSTTAERVWIGTPDGPGTTFRDVVQVCVSRVAAECSSMPTPNYTSERIAVDDRFVSVTSSDDGAIVVVSEQRGVWHVALRAGTGQDAGDLALLLIETDIDEDGVPSVDTRAPRVAFATQGRVDRIGIDRIHTASFDVHRSVDDGRIAVSTATGTLTASSPPTLPGLIELDEVSFVAEIIDGVTVTKLTFVLPEFGLIRALTWSASPSRMISVGGPQASFDELTDLARSLVETSEAEWKAALPEHQVFEESRPVEDD